MAMKYFTILTFLFTTSISAQNYNNAIKKADFLISAHKMQTQIPGCQIAVMVKGKLIWSKGFGFNDLTNKTEVTSMTKLRIASVSKPLTSIALGRLIDLNKINIDQDINSYLATFPAKKHTITTRQLAASTSGIRHYNSKDPKFNAIHYKNIQASLETFKNDPLLFEPDTAFLYSSYGWVLLSAVMEKASGLTFFDLMQQTWDQLEMKNTSFDFPKQDIPNKSEFYISDKKSIRKLAPFEDRSYMYAGGGFLSTAEDLVKIGKEIIEHNFVSEATANTLTQSHKLKNNTSTYYGLGWETGTSRLNTKILYHSGSLPTSVAHLVVYPEHQVVLVYLANTGDNVFFNTREAQTLAEIFAQEEIEKQKNLNPVLIGKWNIETTSLRGKKTKGLL